MRQPIGEVRRNNLRLLIERIGLDEFCDYTRRSRQQVHQIVGRNPSRNIGEKFARGLENKFQLPRYWMDEPHKQSEVGELLDAAEILQSVKFDALLRRMDRLEEFIVTKLLELQAQRKQNNPSNGGEQGTAVTYDETTSPKDGGIDGKSIRTKPSRKPTARP